MTKFVKGKSGNPRGRPKGSATQKKLFEAISMDLPEIIKSMSELAKAGDTTAAKVLLDRAIPPMKAGDCYVQLPLEGNLTQNANTVLSAISSSQITPNQGQTLLNSISSQARITEIDDLIRRIENLETLYANDKTKN